MRLNFRPYWVRAVFTWSHGIPQHYKDVHVLAQGPSDAEDKARHLDPTVHVAKRVFVQPAV